jgi:hypothetical protein
VILRSSDGGAHFAPTGTGSLSLGQEYTDSPTPVAVSGLTWFAVSTATGVVYRSTDDAASWNRTSGVLPRNVVDIQASDPNSATATVDTSSCLSGKTGCTSSVETDATTDAGSSWSTL